LAQLPEHLADMAAFSLATGLRAANVTGLQWSQVDLARRIAWVHPDQAKARKAIPVPLSADAVSLLSKQVGKHLTHVFSYRGKPIVQVSTKAWYEALERAGIEDSRWHTIFGTDGPLGMCRRARCCMFCESWAVGRMRRWYAAALTSARSIWRRTPTVWMHCAGSP
jgi:hypothetical protein